MNTLVLADADALRDHLDALNEAGERCTAAGMDSTPQPFLIALVGAYADGEDVLFDSPWQGDVDWRDGHSNCEDCNGWSHGIEHLRYPVTVLVATPQSTEALAHALLHNEHATRPNQHDEAVAAGEIDCPRQPDQETDHA
jgi:hypothetical protein